MPDGWQMREKDPEHQEVMDVSWEKVPDHGSPSITIQHLCGYYWTERAYKTTALRLESWGFACCRSKRGLDGSYWEIWWLSGLWAAKGDLDLFIGNRARYGKKAKKTLEEVVNWITTGPKRVSYGTLDVSIQKMAATLED